MKKLAILGLGHIGKFVYDELKNNSNFQTVDGYDLQLGHNLSDKTLLENIIPNYDGVLASTPFFLNKQIAELCAKYSVDYFDLTESVEVTEYVKGLQSKNKFITQCGLAPGMVSIIANGIAKKFDKVKDIEIRVGALPANASNHLQYYRTWNTEGLINEYIHPCPALKNKELVQLDPLGDFEEVIFDGLTLEAANTSGGIGSLAKSWYGRAENVNYKTLRYPGHWNHVKFLYNDLGLKSNFDIYVKLFNENIPQCTDDVIYILITVKGQRNNVYTVDQYKKIIRPTKQHTAIQISTGHGVMAVIDVWNQGLLYQKQGWIAQEDIPLDNVWNSKYSFVYV